MCFNHQSSVIGFANYVRSNVFKTTTYRDIVLFTLQFHVHPKIIDILSFFRVIISVRNFRPNPSALSGAQYVNQILWVIVFVQTYFIHALVGEEPDMEKKSNIY